ncbi:MAG: hypothetical protein GY796_10905 [Chloroflexi bacterium]|nr:hypothetical protein [Chloroflexota bacterium]
MSSKRTFLHTLIAVVVLLAQIGQPLANALGVAPTAVNPAPATFNAGQQTQPDRPDWIRPQTEPRRSPQLIPPEPGLRPGEILSPQSAGLTAAAPPPTPFPFGNNNLGQTYKDSNNMEDHPGRHFAGPVNLINGNYFLTVGDHFFVGQGISVQFARSYNHLDANNPGPLGNGWTHSYNVIAQETIPDAEVVIRNSDGSLHVYTSADGGNIWDPPPGIFRTLIHPNMPFSPFEIRHKSGIVETFDPSGRYQSIQDRNGNFVQMNYDGSNRLEAVNSSDGRALDIIYSLTNPNLIESVVDPIGRTTSYNYDANGNLALVDYPEGTAATYTYDANNRLTSYDDPRQPEGSRQVTNVTYDGQDRATNVAFNANSFYDIIYDVTGPLLVEVNWRDNISNVHEIIYDSSNFLVLSDAINVSSCGCLQGEGLNYTPDHLLQSKTDAHNNTVIYDYDGLGNLITIVSPDGARTDFAYDPALSSVISTTNPAGDSIQYLYDARGNLLQETHPLGRTAAYTYDAAGNLLTQTDALSNTTRYTYDALGNLLTISDALSNTTSFDYDPIGRVTSKTDPNGGLTTYAYDDVDRLLLVTDPLSGTIDYTYDSRGNLLTLTDAEGQTLSHAYDSLDRIVTVTNTLGATTSYQYDGLGRLTQRTDADGGATTYFYDEVSRMTQRNYSDGRIDTFAYDRVGNLAAYSDGSITKTIGYDANSRAITYTLDTPTFSSPTRIIYGYDSVGNRSSALLDDGASTWTTTYEYDSIYRLTRTIDANGRTWDTTYDTADRRTSLTLPDNSHVEYDYDGRNNMLELRQYDSGNTLQHTYSFTYDGINNRVTENDDGLLITNAYDMLNRVIQTTADSSISTFTYDAVGNRLTADGPEGLNTFIYDGANRLQSSNDTTYAYDNMGRRISRIGPAGTHQYNYDGEMRLTQFQHVDSAFDATLTYDAMGDLVRKQNSDGDDTFILRGNSRLEAELDANGNLQRTFTADTEIVSMDLVGLTPVTVDFHYDGSGRVRHVTDAASGDTVATYGMDPSQDQANFYNPIRINGLYYIPEIGLYLLGDGQFWDPFDGQFLFRFWPWVFWPFGPFSPWRPIFRYWPWPWPWATPWGWPWPRPWPFLWPWAGVWVRPWLVYPMWPWTFFSWLPWWWWWHWWGWPIWGHWWWWHHWWWWSDWWGFGWWFWGWWGWGWWLWGWWWWPWYWWWPGWWIWGWWLWWLWWPWWWWWHWHGWWWGWWWIWGWWWWPWWCWPPLWARPPDYGDAADPTYPSLLSSNGARHLNTNLEWLGPAVDREYNANITDLDLFDDGVTVDLANSVVIFTVSTSGSLFRYSAAAPVNVHGWIDLNGDGDWADGGEFVLNWSGYPGDGTWPLAAPSTTVTVPIVVPASLPQQTWSRFRLDYAQNVESVTGMARYGEVEDYRLYTAPNPPSWGGAVNINRLSPLVISYVSDMVTNTVSIGFTPTVSNTLVWSTVLDSIAANTVTIHHAPFTPLTTYSVTVSAGQTVAGHWMPANVYTFTSAALAPVYGVVLGPDMAQTGLPGTAVTYTVPITNSGNVTDTFDLTASGNGWPVNLPSPDITLSAGASGTFQALVTIPANTFGGTMDMVAITATSQNSVTATDTANLTTTAQTLLGVTMSPDMAQSSLPGTAVTYTLNLTNSGNVTDTYDLTLNGNGWVTTPSDSSVMLTPGSSVAVTVQVDIPGGANAGDMDSVTVTATSQADVSVTASATLTTTATSYAVALSSDMAQSGLPGTAVTYTVTITNAGLLTDTIDLTLSGNGWSTTAPPTSVTLAVGDTTTTQIVVLIPAGADGGNMDTATIMAQSQGDNTQTAAANLTTTAVSVYGLTVSGNMAQSAAAGTTVTYTVNISNTGNITDTFDLAVSGNMWPTAPMTTSVALARGSSTAVTFVVAIPSSATDGEIDTAVITATSQGDNSQTAATQLTTTAVVTSSGFTIYLPAILRD